jgi:mono/diheme cytochrome c family protein
MPSFAGVLTHDDFDNLVAFLESRVTMPPAQTSNTAGAAAVAQSAGESAPAVPKP